MAFADVTFAMEDVNTIIESTKLDQISKAEISSNDIKMFHIAITSDSEIEFQTNILQFTLEE